jgi:hypothetical protein
MSAACGQDTSVAVAVTHILRYFISSWRRVYACGKCSCDTKVNYLSQAVLDVLESFVIYNTKLQSKSMVTFRICRQVSCHLLSFCDLAHGNCSTCVGTVINLMFTDLPAQPSLALDPIYPTMVLFFTHPVQSGFVSIMLWFMFLLLLALSGCDDSSLRRRT